MEETTPVFVGSCGIPDISHVYSMPIQNARWSRRRSIMQRSDRIGW